MKNKKMNFELNLSELKKIIDDDVTSLFFQIMDDDEPVMIITTMAGDSIELKNTISLRAINIK